MEYLEDELHGMEFEGKMEQQIRKLVFEQVEKTGKFNLDQILAQSDLSQSAYISGLLAVPFEVSENWEKFDIRAPGIDDDLEGSIQSALMHFKFKKVRNLLRENQEKIKSCTDEGELEKLLKMQVHLLNLKKELTDTLGNVIHS